MTLSIVVTTFNREAVLKQLLQSLEQQSDREFQVVVAIDGATDSTEQMLESIKTSYSLKWVNTHCSGYGLAVARNSGILAADGKIIAIIDDDCFPCRDYVAALKRSVRHGTITGGPRTPSSVEDTKQVDKMRELARLPTRQPLSFEHIRRNWPKAVITECNICAFRADLIELGMFSERLKIYGFIGQEFFARVENFGFKYQFDPEAEIVHHRQADGDNSLTLKKKARQIRIATALRPALMTPSQYAVQANWAKSIAETYPKRIEPPAIPRSAWLAFPYRFLRNRAGDVKRRIRRILKG